AIYELHVLEAVRASGFTGWVQFGDISVLLASFCIAGIFWAWRQPRRGLWLVFLSLGTLAGGYACVASGTRSSWLVVPFIWLIFFAAFVDRKRWKIGTMSMTSALLVICLIGASLPSIQARYNAAVYDLQTYSERRNTGTSIGSRLETWRVV